MEVDLLIIGGGINGCGIARDAAGRGLSVALCDMGDLASATSSWSSKLIHGGLRYLENFEFKLVHEALNEREVLMHSAPFIIHPLEFILPYEKHLRSPWMLRLGLFLYDHLGKRSQIPGSKKVLFNKETYGNALQDSFEFGFSYYDCQTDDSRLTLLCARDAFEHGANIMTYMACEQLQHNSQIWTATLKDQLSDERMTINAKAVINAGGPWVDHINQNIAHVTQHNHTQLVKGSHIVVPKLYDGQHAYILQNQDGRIVFTIPYLNHFTLIGTTDVNYEGNPAAAAITDSEVNYLCELVNSYFRQQVSAADIVWSYSGVRPLYNNHANSPSKTTRDFHLELFDKDTPPYLSIYGGKITTFRVLAEEALKKLKLFFPDMTAAWTKTAFLPGGDLQMGWEDFLKQLTATYPWLPESQRLRYAKAYGTHIHQLIGDAKSIADLGEHFGADLYEHEVLYWIENEWAQFSEDMLWRRSKLGLALTYDQLSAVKRFIDEPITTT